MTGNLSSILKQKKRIDMKKVPFLLLLIVLIKATFVSAHEIRPAYLQIIQIEAHTYEVLLNTPNGGFDENFENDNLKKTFTYGHNLTKLEINTDDYGYEVSYEIQDAEDASKIYHLESRF